jgi:hypothetical protein
MKLGRIIYLVFILALWSCGPSVTTSSKKPDLSRYKTYAWNAPDVKTDNPNFSGDVVDNEIKANVDKEMSAKGFTLDNNNPDLYITYHTYTEQKVASSPGYYYPGYTFSPYYGYGGWGYGYGWGPGLYGGYYGGGYYTPPTTYTYTEGYLTLDFIDAKTHQTVWRGSAEGSVDNADHLAKKIGKGVHSIMKKVPEEAYAKQ